MSSPTDGSVIVERCPAGASFWSMLGQVVAVVFSSIGAAYGTAKAGSGLGVAGLINSAPVTKLTLPVIMAGILSIYGLITSLLINSRVRSYTNGMPLYVSYAHFGAGLCCGLAALAAGLAIGVSGGAAVKAVAKQPSLFVVMLIVLIFSEALALYGLIIALILSTKSADSNFCISSVNQ
ncbi:Vacuolar ATP synthase 16 kDa proteolipid subunit [Giardia duodenalis assemblage B]|uniref:V-type proton ATPase proteolipid subunit n=3 Tax=Giardia intestinalis TaxID=5741 RepID=A0A132NWJ2_GIAIN|nr:Vacuolar ATP synthase 16 kDa proteolipid subunit [Giardia intestinalis ATCC 50581]ESU43659.1 Vacuolar ATP synthase proteolipid subunit [Giardia intestinalis]KWX14445.1 Vacuolar ATP synthase 16 kDa proteolipid subunit [Giardia intestinalis assemblage B]